MKQEYRFYDDQGIVVATIDPVSCEMAFNWKDISSRTPEEISAVLVNHLLQFWSDKKECIIFCGPSNKHVMTITKGGFLYTKPTDLRDQLQIQHFERAWVERVGGKLLFKQQPVTNKIEYTPAALSPYFALALGSLLAALITLL